MFAKVQRSLIGDADFIKKRSEWLFFFGKFNK